MRKNHLKYKKPKNTKKGDLIVLEVAHNSVLVMYYNFLKSKKFSHFNKLLFKTK